MRTRSDSASSSKSAASAGKMPQIAEAYVERVLQHTTAKQFVDEMADVLAPESKPHLCEKSDFVGIIHNLHARIRQLETDMAILKRSAVLMQPTTPPSSPPSRVSRPFETP